MIIKQSKIVIACTLSLLLVLTLLVATGCSPQAETTLSGWVYANEPISSSVLSIYDTSGKQILGSESISANEQGAILIGTKKKLPSNFRIVAEGGTHNGGELVAKLSADVREYNAESDTIYINPATTIVSAYIDKHPEIDLVKASTLVKKFLEIPEYIDLASGTQLSNEYFDNLQFMTEAGENGGINLFIDNLLAEMEAGSTHSFQETRLYSVGKSIAITLAEGAGSYVGGELMGWGLDKAGIGFGEEDHTAEDIAKIKEGMAEMKLELAQMSTQLDAVIDKLDNITTMLEKISRKQDLIHYSNRVQQLNTLISNVYSIRRDLDDFIINTPDNPEPTRQRLIDRIESKIIDNADVIHNTLMGLVGENSLINHWRELVYVNRFLDSDDYNKVKTQYDFFKEYQDAILRLQVEYYHAIEEKPGQNKAIIMDCIDRYNTQIEKQEALMPLPIEKNMVVDTKWDGVYYSKNTEMGNFDVSFPLSNITKSQVHTHMTELSNSNYAGFDDWEALDYNSIGALIENYKFNRDPMYWSEFMVNQGWPGTKFEGATMVPFYRTSDGKLVYFLNTGSHFNRIYEYTDAGLKNVDFCMIMVYRRGTAEDYGYKHLLK